uniref:Uncharacterized protein n=1 Tax=Colobus angolensis palliatus TaxID=336983 RepID=A0A2K5JN78_COLAP
MGLLVAAGWPLLDCVAVHLSVSSHCGHACWVPSTTLTTAGEARSVRSPEPMASEGQPATGTQGMPQEFAGLTELFHSSERSSCRRGLQLGIEGQMGFGWERGGVWSQGPVWAGRLVQLGRGSC